MEPIGANNLESFLTAFADGELDATQNLQVLDYLAEHPEAVQFMRVQQRLRLESERIIRAQTPPVPETLRNRITAAVRDNPTIAPKARTESRTGLSHWFRRFAVAAALLTCGGIVGAIIRQPRGGDLPKQAVTVTKSPVQTAVLDAVVHVHVECSRLAEHLHAAKFPKDLGSLAQVVREDFHREEPYPDLTQMGYELVGAGPCGHPLEGTVHLLYHSTQKDLKDTLSIFVQPYTGQYSMNPRRAYLITDAHAAHPVLAWRTAGAAYFVVGDDLQVVRDVAQTVAKVDLP